MKEKQQKCIAICIQHWHKHSALVQVFSIDTCIQHWYMYSALVHVFCIGTRMQHWYTYTALVHVFRIGTCIQYWYMYSALVHVFSIGTCIQHWYKYSALLLINSLWILLGLKQSIHILEMSIWLYTLQRVKKIWGMAGTDSGCPLKKFFFHHRELTR